MASTPDFDRLLAMLIAGLFLLFLLRCVLGGALLALGRTPGAVGLLAHRWGRAVTPRVVRRVTAGLLGVLSSGLVVAPVAAADQQPAPGGFQLGTNLVIDRVSEVPREATRRVVVQEHDCLWSLAEEQLGSAATNEVVDRQWKRWYRLNRSQIGPNPDVIATGMTLLVPVVSK